MASHATTAPETHGHPALQHHFENMEQQREAGTLGMWVFLVTEIMFFGGMFLAYTLYRSMYPAAFASASNHLDITLGAVNTGVLMDFGGGLAPSLAYPNLTVKSGVAWVDGALPSCTQRVRRKPLNGAAGHDARRADVLQQAPLASGRRSCQR